MSVGIGFVALSGDCQVCTAKWVGVAPVPYIQIDNIQHINISKIRCPSCETNNVNLILHETQEF
jgi:ribosomal protein L37AE/L43A